ncbi:MAG: PRC-barrel domain-containing protein [Pseudohongiellaceae bacterium]
MNKLHTIAFYALIAPTITLSSAAVLAQQSTGQDVEREQPSTQRDRDRSEALTSDQDRDRQEQRTHRGQDANRSTRASTQSDQSTHRAGQSDSQAAAGSRNMRDDQSRMENRGFMNSVPANGMNISALMGADVKTSGDDDVGSVEDLILNEDGQIVAIVVGVGGFLGMGQKDVAIGWDDITKSGEADELELRIDSTRDELRDAPEFESDE